MSLKTIRARFECDGCGREFFIELASDIEGDMTLFDIAVAELSSGFAFHSYVGETRSSIEESFMTSVQAGQHLCPACTRRVDDFVPQEREATADEIAKALA